MKGKNFWGLALIVGFTLIAGTVFAASCSKPSTDNSQSEEQGFYYNGILLGTSVEADADGDWISDRLEFREYGTDPLKSSTDDDVIDDFNEIFTYPHLLDPLDPTDAQKFIEMLPNVEAKAWKWDTGGTEENLLTKYTEIAKKDPLVQWYADHIIIEWQDSEHNFGSLKINEEPLFLEHGPLNPFVDSSGHPIDSLGNISSYYLTHGRKGVCSEVAIAHYPILELMGYECLLVSGQGATGKNHAWLEANIAGRTYVVDYNYVTPVDVAYQIDNWTIVAKQDI